MMLPWGERSVKNCCVENMKGRLKKLKVAHCAYVKKENSVKTNNELYAVSVISALWLTLFGFESSENCLSLVLKNEQSLEVTQPR